MGQGIIITPRITGSGDKQGVVLSGGSFQVGPARIVPLSRIRSTELLVRSLDERGSQRFKHVLAAEAAIHPIGLS